MSIVDISRKKDVLRTAKASGRIMLHPGTLNRIKNGEVAKGDALEIARAASLLSVKNVPHTIPHCHPIPITSVAVDFIFGGGEGDEDSGSERGYIEVAVTVSAFSKTGVEIEALSGVMCALLTLFDVVKTYEKEDSMYPTMRIYDIKVVKKEKINMN